MDILIVYKIYFMQKKSLESERALYVDKVLNLLRRCTFLYLALESTNS